MSDFRKSFVNAISFFADHIHVGVSIAQALHQIDIFLPHSVDQCQDLPGLTVSTLQFQEGSGQSSPVTEFNPADSLDLRLCQLISVVFF